MAGRYGLNNLKPIALTMKRGTGPSFEIEVQTASGGIQNLTDWDLSFKAGLDYDTAAITKTVGLGITVDDPTTGVLVVTLITADTSALSNTEDTTYVFEVSGVHSTDYPQGIVLGGGTLTIEPAF